MDSRISLGITTWNLGETVTAVILITFIDMVTVLRYAYRSWMSIPELRAIEQITLEPQFPHEARQRFGWSTLQRFVGRIMHHDAHPAHKEFRVGQCATIAP